MSDLVNVLMTNDSLNVGGAERVAVDIANTLDRSRFEVSFCSTRVDGPLRTQLHDDVTVDVLHRRATWDLPKLLDFARLVRERDIQLVHSHGRGTMKFVAMARALGLIHCRHVFHDHFGWLHIDRSAGRFSARSDVWAHSTSRTSRDGGAAASTRHVSCAIRHSAALDAVRISSAHSAAISATSSTSRAISSR